MRRASIDLPKSGYIGRTADDGAAGIGHEEVLAVTEPRAETGEAWAERLNASASSRPQCACGCGRRIRVIAKHRSVGLPRYLPRHGPNPLRRGFDRLREGGYQLVSDVIATLGVSATTLGRMEAEGAIPKAKRIVYARGKEARVYTKAQVRGMVRSRVRERWRRGHPGRWGIAGRA